MSHHGTPKQTKTKAATAIKTEAEGRINIKNAQFQSLVKYDTPYLVSTTLNNKKAFEEMGGHAEKTDTLLRNIINKKGNEGEKTEYDDYSVKDALNKILPPKKILQNDQLWVQYVSCTPVTKVEVMNLKEGLDKRLKTLKAKDTGICITRELLYNECFDELIRQVTINCLERGILMMRIQKESEMTIKAYQNLYQSAIAYGIRSWLIVEEDKRKMTEQISQHEDDCETLTAQIEKLENDINDLIKNDDEQRAINEHDHAKFVKDTSEKINFIKEEIRTKYAQIKKG